MFEAAGRTMLLPVLCLFVSVGLAADGGLTGKVTDPQGKRVPGAEVRLAGGGIRRDTRTGEQGQFSFAGLAASEYVLTGEAVGLRPVTEKVVIGGETVSVELRLSHLAGQHESVVITAKSLEPSVDLRNSEVFSRTLFTRDDQVLEQLNAGINAG